jgi:imidazolonepropionase-like amidohydrolase
VVAIEPGKRANLVLPFADPLEDIAHTTKIVAVIFNGQLLDLAALDAMVTDLDARYAP